MTDPIPAEAVEAAARARFDSAHYVNAWPSLPARERRRWLDQTRPWVTAAAPYIAAQATADLRDGVEALRDEWRTSTVRCRERDGQVFDRPKAEYLYRCAAALDALLRGA